MILVDGAFYCLKMAVVVKTNQIPFWVGAPPILEPILGGVGMFIIGFPLLSLSTNAQVCFFCRRNFAAASLFRRCSPAQNRHVPSKPQSPGTALLAPIEACLWVMNKHNFTSSFGISRLLRRRLPRSFGFGKDFSNVSYLAGRFDKGKLFSRLR